MEAYNLDFTDNERVIVGCVYFGLSMIVLPIHLLFLSLFIIYKDYRTKLAYNIMLSIGITECLQLTGHLYSGVAVLADDFSYQFIEELAGNISNASCIALVPQTLVLALNRFIVFKRYKSNYSKIFKFLILCCWIYGLLFFAAYMTPYTGLKFYKNCFCWALNDGLWSEMAGHAEFYSSAPTLILTFIVYIAIVIVIAHMRSTMTTSNNNKHFYEKNEMKLLIQSFITFLYPTFLLFAWHYSPYFLPNSHWIPVAIDILWIIFCGLNPMLYFIMNKQIRSRFLLVLRCKIEGNGDKVKILLRP